MSCTAQQSEVTALRNRRNEQQELVDNLPHNAGWQLASDELARIQADLTEAEAALELCQDQAAQAANPVPQPITGKVDKIQCHDASKEVGHDEPYLLIATFDMTDAVNLGVVGMTFPDISVLKIGPWIGVDKGETHYANHLSSANRPDFWDLNSDARPIAHHQDVIFLVAMCENDGSSPDRIRGDARANMLAARVTNTNRTYDAYVTAMISIMTGSIETTPHPGPRSAQSQRGRPLRDRQAARPQRLRHRPAQQRSPAGRQDAPLHAAPGQRQRDQRLHRHVLVHGLNVVDGSGDGTAASQPLRSEIVTTTSRAVDSKGSAELFERARDFRRRPELTRCYRP